MSVSLVREFLASLTRLAQFSQGAFDDNAQLRGHAGYLVGHREIDVRVIIPTNRHERIARAIGRAEQLEAIWVDDDVAHSSLAGSPGTFKSDFFLYRQLYAAGDSRNRARTDLHDTPRLIQANRFRDSRLYLILQLRPKW